MVIADRATVRLKAGNRSTELLPDADIDEAIQASDAIVQAALNKFGWDVSEPGYYAVKEISELFAAADILARYQDTQDRSKEELDQAKYLLGILKENFQAATGNEDPGNVITMAPAEFKTWPLNPSAGYRRAYGRGEATESLHAFTGTGDI